MKTLTCAALAALLAPAALADSLVDAPTGFNVETNPVLRTTILLEDGTRLVATGSFGLFGGGGDLEDSVDPYSQNMTLALAAGITTAVNGNTVAKLKPATCQNHTLVARKPTPSARRDRCRAAVPELTATAWAASL